MNRRKFLTWLSLAPAVAPKVVEAATLERYASGGFMLGDRIVGMECHQVLSHSPSRQNVSEMFGCVSSNIDKAMADYCLRGRQSGEPERVARSRRPCPRRRGVLKKQLKPALRRQS